MSISVAITKKGAEEKLRMLRAVGEPWVTRYIMEDMGSRSTKALLLAISNKLGKSKAVKGLRTAHLERNVGFHVGEDSVTIGTGLYADRQPVAYAKIQDVGGTTHPRVTKRLRGWAWAMYFAMGEVGVQADMYKAIALTKKKTLNVKVPATGWFTDTMKEQVELLGQRMTPEWVLKIAKKLAAKG